jgi:hypothetical protein
MMNSFLERATAFADRGFHVFPLQRNGKAPLADTKGFKEATLDRAQLYRWSQMYPDSNIGIVPGWSGFVVVDMDYKPEQGLDGRREFMDRYGSQETMFVRTPSGGLHAWFRLPEDVQGPANSAGRLGPGIDVRSINGYVVAPGSVINGREYQMVGHWSDIARCPETLLERFVSAGEERTEDADEWKTEPDLPENIERARDRVDRWIVEDDLPVAGNRSNVLFKLACTIRDLGISAEKSEELLEPWNDALDDPLPEDRFRSTIHNAHRYAKHPAGHQARPPEEVFAGIQIPEPATTSEWELYTPEEADALPDPEWLIDGVLPETGITILFGPRSSYKTFVALDMAACVVTGKAWGRPDGEGQTVNDPGTVVYAAGEGAGYFKHRRAAWEKANGKKLGSRFLFSPKLPRPGADPQDVVRFAREIAKRKPRLVILDTLTRLSVGLDENKAQDAGKVFQALEHIQNECKCNVLVIGHSGKDIERGLRGSSVIPDNADTVLGVEADRTTKELSVKLVKQKDGRDDLDPWVFRLNALSDVEALVEPINGRSVPDKDTTEQDFRVGEVRDILSALEPGQTLPPDILALSMHRRSNLDAVTAQNWIRANWKEALREFVVVEKPLEFGRRRSDE